MKKYVFLTFAVFGIGGTQIYLKNKIKYLRENGYEPVVITEETDGAVLVRELEPYKDCIVPELLGSPMMLSRKRRNVLLSRMADIVGECDTDTVIESNFIHATLWGELLAKKINARHLILLIQEDYSLKDKRYLKFFNYKYERNELAANTPVALTRLFEGYRSIDDPIRTFLNPYCANTVEDCKSEHDAAYATADYHIGSVGRINKPFVIPMVKDIIAFAEKHKDKTLQLFMFGGDPDPKYAIEIRNLCEPVDNLSVYLTGPVYPVPLRLLRKMDVFISSAGAVSTTAKQGLMTIAIDANDFKPIGIVTADMVDTVHRLPGTVSPDTEKLLESVLINHEDVPHCPCINESALMDSFYKIHIDFIAKMTADREYYNIKRVSPYFVARVFRRLRAFRG